MSEVNARNGGFEYRETGGYDRAQVDSFINEVKKYIAGQKNEKQLLTQKLHVLAVKIQEYQALEQENGTLEERCKALRGENDVLELAVEKLKAQKDLLEKELEDLNASVEKKKSDAEALRVKVNALGTEAGRLSAMATEEQRKNAADTMAAVSAELAAIKEELARRCGIIENVLKKSVVSVSEASNVSAEGSAEASEADSGLTVADLLEEPVPAAPVSESAEEHELTDEETRQSRDAARSVLRSMTGVDSDEGPTKLMPDALSKVNIIGSSGSSVDIVINARTEEAANDGEVTGWCAPEGSMDESNDSAEDEAVAVIPASDPAPAVADADESQSSVSGLTEEEAANLSYDDALALVLKKNGIERSASSVRRTPSDKKPEKDANAFDSEPQQKKNAAPKADEKSKKEKRGFFAALKRNIDAILDDEDDEEEEEEYLGTEVFSPSDDQKKASGNADDQPTMRFGNENVKK